MVGCKTSTSDPPPPAHVPDAEPAPAASSPPATPRASRPAKRPAKVSYESEPKTWCLAHDAFAGIGDLVVPPFTMSAADAMWLTHATKHVRELKRRYRYLVVDQDKFECARLCEPQTWECGFHFPLVDRTDWERPKEVEWVYVDPFERKLWFPVEGGWASEELPGRN